MIRAAVIGIGDIAPMHLDAIASIEDAELVAVAEPDPGRAADAAALGVPVFADVVELIEAVHPDVVHVTTPHHQHVPVAVEALRRGVPVLTEKPLANSRIGADELLEVVRETGTKLGVCFQNRYNLSSQRLKALIDTGELGEITGAWANVVWHRAPEYYASRPWRGRLDQAGSGVLANQSIHTLDLLQWFFGGVDQVSGMTSTTTLAGMIEVEDTAAAQLVHPNGARSTFFATVGSPVQCPVELVVWGSGGMARISDGLELTWHDGRTELIPERVVESRGRSYWGASHELLIRDFYERLDDPEPFWIDAAQADISMRMMRDIFAHQGLADHPMVAG